MTDEAKPQLSADDISRIVGQVVKTETSAIETNFNKNFTDIKSSVEDLKKTSKEVVTTEEDPLENIDPNDRKIIMAAVNREMAKHIAKLQGDFDTKLNNKMSKSESVLIDKVFDTIEKRKITTDTNINLTASYPDLTDDKSDLTAKAREIYQGFPETVRGTNEAKELAVIKAAQQLGIQPKKVRRPSVVNAYAPVGGDGDFGDDGSEGLTLAAVKQIAKLNGLDADSLIKNYREKGLLR